MQNSSQDECLSIVGLKLAIYVHNRMLLSLLFCDQFDYIKVLHPGVTYLIYLLVYNIEKTKQKPYLELNTARFKLIRLPCPPLLPPLSFPIIVVLMTPVVTSPKTQ